MRLQLEPVLQRFFGHWGTLVSGSPWRIISPMLVVLIAISFGIIPLEKQNDPAELWIADRGRIKDELSYYRDSFEELSPNLQALIVQPKKGDGKVNLLDPKALEEVVELQDWVMQYEYAHRIPGVLDLVTDCILLWKAYSHLMLPWDEGEFSVEAGSHSQTSRSLQSDRIGCN